MSSQWAVRARPALLLLLLLLLSCCLLSSAFEAGRKKTDKDGKQQQPHQAQLRPASVKHSQQAAATISSEGDVSVQPADAATVTAAGAKVAAAMEQTLDSVSLQLEHDPSGDGGWQRRGDVDISFSSSSSSGSGQRGGGVRFSSEELSSEDRRRLQQLVDSDGFYRVRVNTGTVSSPRYVVASVRACALAASALHQHFLFHFDIHGRLIAIQLSTPITACPHPAPASSLPAAFTSKAKLSFGRTAEKPANIRLRLQPGEQSAKDAAAGGAEGSKEEERTFWQKYWMYILPFGGFMLLQAFMGAMTDKKDGDGGGQRATGSSSS